MRTTHFCSAGLALILLTVAGAASASPDFPDKIPNGNAIGCKACHPGSPPATNAFGTAYAMAGENWIAIAGQDSDGDGQTNGEELGDPCGTGKAARTDDISNPGDKASVAMNPKTPPCGTMSSSASSSAAGAGSGAGSGAGGSGSSSAAVSTGTMSATPEETTAAGPGHQLPAPTPGVRGACASIAPTDTGSALGALWLLVGGLALRRRWSRRDS